MMNQIFPFSLAKNFAKVYEMIEGEMNK